MGVRYTFDSNAKAFVFDTVEAVDKTMDGAQASGNIPVIFSVRYDNLQDLQYTASALDEVTTVYVTEEAEEEGETGTITVFGDDVTGYARSEVLVNRGEDDSEPKELAEEAVQQPALSFTAQIYEDDNLLYGVDYDVGDLVTAWVELPGVKVVGSYYDPIRQWVKVNQQITCISEHYGSSSSGTGRSLDITLGQPEKSLPEQVKEIRKKEKKLTADKSP